MFAGLNVKSSLNGVIQIRLFVICNMYNYMIIILYMIILYVLNHGNID